jgi:DNA repair protein RadA/Sms
MPAVKKQRTVYVCQTCGHQSPKWLGRCPSCETWSSLVEELALSPSQKAAPATLAGPAAAPVRLCDVQTHDSPRLSTQIDELDRVLGGGLVRGSLVLVGGDPGIGKSTLLLQAMQRLTEQGLRALYVTAEESLAQVKLRAERLGIAADAPLYLLAQTSMDVVDAARAELRPDVLVIDSVQTVGCPELSQPAGTVGQVRAVTQRLMQAAKGDGIATLVVGHVTKEGTLAGPKVMEHMVDTVLYFEGERTGPYRILRAHKNRFGSAQEIGVFEMAAAGLQPVKNPSALFLSQRAHGPGSTVITSLEGSRPILLEVQALVTPACLGGTPRRNTTGFEPQRVAMLCAVLTARAKVDLGGSDVFVNVAGGVRVSEPAADLGILLALASAASNLPIAAKWTIIGEVGLAGEVRAATQLPARLADAASLGFSHALVPQANLEMDRQGELKGLPIQLQGVRQVGEALQACEVAPARRQGTRGARP